jgi:hypothetical protein
LIYAKIVSKLGDLTVLSNASNQNITKLSRGEMSLTKAVPIVCQCYGLLESSNHLGIFSRIFWIVFLYCYTAVIIKEEHFSNNFGRPSYNGVLTFGTMTVQGMMSIFFISSA